MLTRVSKNNPMNDKSKTKEQLLRELSLLRTEIAQLEQLNVKYKQADEERKETKIFLENVFNTSADGIIVTDPFGTITMVNPAVEDMLGYSTEELIGKNSIELRPEGSEFEEKGRAFITRLLEDGVIRGIERTWQKKDGSLIEIDFHAALLKDNDGEITGAVGSIRDITERKWAERKLIEYQKQLRSLASQLTLTEESDRRTFATYLHDHIGQSLFILKIKLETLLNTVRSPDISQHLQETTGIIEQLIKDTRSLTFELSPPILYQLGFEAALDWLFEQMHNQYGIETSFQNDKSPKPLDDDVLILLFRGVRELLVNVGKHARAQHVTVTTRRDDDHIVIQVEDNGIGFDLSDVDISTMPSKGFGLFSIKERLDHIGGRLYIDSQAGHGARITLIAPLKSKNTTRETS